MRFWGIVFNAEYDSSGTSVDSEYAISQLQEIGLNATSLSDYNGKDVISQLKKVIELYICVEMVVIIMLVLCLENM